MKSGTELIRQQTIDQSVARHPVQSVKTGTRDGDIEMRLPAAAKRLCSGMMGMTGAVIVDFQTGRCQFPLKDGCNPLPSGGWRRGRP